MSADESASLEEQFSLLLAACDEALAVGDPAASVYESAAPAELRPRLKREAEWCRLVRALWSRVAEGAPPRA